VGAAEIREVDPSICEGFDLIVVGAPMNYSEMKKKESHINDFEGE